MWDHSCVPYGMCVQYCPRLLFSHAVTIISGQLEYVRYRTCICTYLYVYVAGALLVREAGGRITDLEDTEWSLTCRKICATNGAIHDEMLQALNDAGIV